ncbi:MAG: 50S ribosomal protein L31 [Clostridiales bacterium]|nr:50S ribosomal protein L31 [Clostridiales bacterium]
MKSGIHPNYEEVTVRCACGETVKTRSTKIDGSGEIRVDICSKCHPFFTGKQKFVDAGGRVDKFKKRLEKSGK